MTPSLVFPGVLPARPRPHRSVLRGGRRVDGYAAQLRGLRRQKQEVAGETVRPARHV